MKGPYSSISPSGDSHWAGKKTCSVFDAEGRKVCVVPTYPERTRDGALVLAEHLANVLNGTTKMDAESK